MSNRIVASVSVVPLLLTWGTALVRSPVHVTPPIVHPPAQAATLKPQQARWAPGQPATLLVKTDRYNLALTPVPPPQKWPEDRWVPVQARPATLVTLDPVPLPQQRPQQRVRPGSDPEGSKGSTHPIGHRDAGVDICARHGMHRVWLSKWNWRCARH